MPLETPTYISDLVPTNPASGDPAGQGDDHLRAIKSALKTTFPNVAGAVTVTQNDLNGVPGIKAEADASAASLATLNSTVASNGTTLASLGTTVTNGLAIRPTFANFHQFLASPNGGFDLPNDGIHGTVIQYGQATITADGLDNVLSFTTPFPVTELFLMVVPAAGRSFGVNFGYRDRSTFTASASPLNNGVTSNSAVTLTWYAIGY